MVSLTAAKQLIHSRVKDATKKFLVSLAADLMKTEVAVDAYPHARAIREVFDGVKSRTGWICPRCFDAQMELVSKVLSRYAATERFFFPYVMFVFLGELKKRGMLDPEWWKPGAEEIADVKEHYSHFQAGRADMETAVEQACRELGVDPAILSDKDAKGGKGPEKD